MSTLPVPTRAWATFDVALTQTALGTAALTNKRVLRLTWATARTNGLLTLDYGCDGTTAGTKGDHVDRIVTDANIVGNNPGSAHSWWVDTVAGVGGQMCFDRDGPFDGSGSVYYSESVGFTGGTTTARPTASDEIEITSSTNVLHTVNGDHVVEMLCCTVAGQEGIRWVIHNSGATAGPCAMLSIERATGYPSSVWSGIIHRYMGASGTVGNLTDWNSTGWQARISGTVRTLTALVFTAQSASDPEGDKLLSGTRLVNATIGDVGYVDDWWWQDDSFAVLMGYSSPDGVRRWQANDEPVWPHGGTDRGGGNTTGAKLRITQQPTGGNTVAPVITMITATGQLPGTFAQARNASIHFTVTDIAPGLLTVPIYIRFAGVSGEQVLYRRGLFRGTFSGTVTAITNGFDFAVNPPPGGWPGTVTIIIDAVDSDGNMVAA